MEAANKINHSLEGLTALTSLQDNSCTNVGNIYDTIDIVPIGPSSSSEPKLQSPSQPDAAAGFSADYILPDYSTDKAPTRYMSMSAPSSSPRSASLASVPASSSSSSPSSPAAACTYSVVRDDFDDLADTAAIDQRPDNSSPAAAAASSRSDIYDSIDDTYQNVTASAPEPTALVSDEAASCTEDAANQVYLQPDNAVNDVPCCYEMTLNVEPSGDVYANCQQELDVGESTA